MRRCDIKKHGNYADTILSALEPDPTDYRLNDGHALYFLVKKSGNKSWQFRYKRNDGKWSWLGLGAYPKVKASQARVLARKYLEKIDDGTFEVNGKNKAIPYQYTFKALMSSWLLNRKEVWAIETHTKAEKSIHKHIYPLFGDRDYRNITRKEWFDFFSQLKQKNINTQLKKLLSYVKGAFDWSSIYGGETFNPLDGITKFLNLDSQYIFKEDRNILSVDELPHLFHAIRGYPNKMISIALELSFHTIARPSELAKAQWSEFDLKNNTWTIPPYRMKNRKVHKIPLSKQAVALLIRLQALQLNSPFLFPNKLDSQKSISDNTLNNALQKLGYKDAHTVHRCRHIFSTFMNEQFSHKSPVIEAILAHKKEIVEGTYNKATHFDERRKLMQWWSDKISVVAIRY